MKPKAIIAIVVLVAAVGIVLALKEINNPSRDSEQVKNEEMVTNPASIQKTNLPRLVDLGADKCIPCKMMAPILEELREEYAGRLEVIFIDVWKEPEAGDYYGVRLIPTQIFFDPSGKELFRHEGFMSKEDILGKWKELQINLEEVNE